MEIIIKTEKDFCDCKDCIKEFLKEFSRQFKMGVVKGEFKITDNQNKVNWEILNTDIGNKNGNK
jgi:hypothetical protein